MQADGQGPQARAEKGRLGGLRYASTPEAREPALFTKRSELWLAPLDRGPAHGASCCAFIKDELHDCYLVQASMTMRAASSVSMGQRELPEIAEVTVVERQSLEVGQDFDPGPTKWRTNWQVEFNIFPPS